MMRTSQTNKQPHVTDEPKSRPRSREDDELADAISEVVSMLIDAGVVWASPHAKRFWNERARPAIRSRWNNLARSRGTDRQFPTRKPPIVVEAALSDPSQELIAATEGCRINMSRAEAQARYLLAQAAKTFSDEQMNIVSTAHIIDGDEGFVEEQRALAELPAQHVASIIDNFLRNQPLLNSASSELGMILGHRRVDGGYVQIEEPKDQ